MSLVRPLVQVAKINQKLQLNSIPKSFACVRPTLQFSTPHPISNIRFIKLQKGTALDRNWIEYRQLKVYENHLFWLENNVAFLNQKDAFVKQFGNKVTAEQLSVFYKQYLEQSHEKMVEYNKKLWRDSIASLGPGIRYEFEILKRWIQHQQHQFQERIRMYIMLWFTAGLTTPLLFLK